MRSRTHNIRSEVNMFKRAFSYENSSANLNSCYIEFMIKVTRLHSIRVAYELLKFILTRFIAFLFFLFLFLTGKQDDDDVPGRSSTRVCKPPGGGSSLSLS